MKKLLKRLSPFAQGQCVNVVVETPKGSRVKYAYNFKCGLFELRRALPEGMMFPFNFGFIPGTKAANGDPLDILILNEEPLVPGCLLRARLLGAIKAEQTEDGHATRNDRLLGLAISKETPTSLESFELDKKTRGEIEYFFTTYNKLDGKKFKVLGKAGPKKARAMVRQAVKNVET
jgi:inorganic pyrophosphatase